MTKTLTIEGDLNESYWLKVKFPYHEKLKEAIKRIPGSRWTGDVWQMPADCIGVCAQLAQQFAFGLNNRVVSRRLANGRGVESTRLHTYQRESVHRALTEARLVINHEMGLGKTPIAVEVMRVSNCQRALVICPAVVRTNWLRELAKWWPEHPEAVGHRWGRANKSRPKYAADWYNKPIQIVSYGMVGDVERKAWDCIIIDECHRLQSPASIQSRAVRAVVEANPKAIVLGLTATLMPNQPSDAWNVLDTLWPGRFGQSKPGKIAYSFLNRYVGKEENQWAPSGFVFKGVNEQHADELKTRLSSLSVRTTKTDVAHLLPAYDVHSLFVEPGARSEYKKRSLTIRTGEDMEETLALAAVEKLGHIIEWVADATQSTTHVAIMVYFRESATLIADALSAEGYNVTKLTGEQPAHQRMKMLDEAKAADKSVIVCTMKSVGIGIDLTKYSQALFAELYYVPETIEQALGRFSRLSGTVPSSVTLMVMEGTLDEHIAHVLEDKLTALNQCVSEGATAASTREALGAQEDFIASILDKINSSTIDDYT